MAAAEAFKIGDRGTENMSRAMTGVLGNPALLFAFGATAFAALAWAALPGLRSAATQMWSEAPDVAEEGSPRVMTPEEARWYNLGCGDANTAPDEGRMSEEEIAKLPENVQKAYRAGLENCGSIGNSRPVIDQ